MTNITYVSDILKLIFKAYKKSNKICFSIYKRWQLNNIKERLWKKVCGKYLNLSKEEKTER